MDTTPATRRFFSTVPVIVALNSEWTTLRDSPAGHKAVRRWARTQPILMALTSLGELEEDLRRANTERGDQLLLAVMHQVVAGDELAARFVVQAMLGKVVKLARSLRGVLPGDDPVEMTLHALLESIRRYRPGHHTPKVGSWLALGTLRTVRQVVDTRISPERQATVVDTELVLTLAGGGRTATSTADTGEDPVCSVTSPAFQITELLTAARRAGVVSASDALLLQVVYSSSTPGSAEIARALGIGVDAVRMRCCRAVAKLRAYVAAVDADQPLPLAV